MRAHCLTSLVLVTASLALASTAFAQDSGGYGGGMGGGGMGGGGGRGGGHHRGGGQRGGGQGHSQGNAPDGRPAPSAASLVKQLTGVVTIAGGNKALTPGTVTSDKPDVSAVYAELQAQIKMDSVQVISHAIATLVDDSRRTGINSALLIGSGANVAMTGGSITTTGDGGNGAFVSDTGSHLMLSGVTVTTRASGAYGLEASGGAALDATNVTVATLSDHAAAVATDNGGGMVTLTGGSFTTSGQSSSGLFSTGMLSGDGVKVTTDRADALTVLGRHGLTLSNAVIEAGGNGAMIYSTDNPDANPAGGGGPRPGMGGYSAQPSNPDPTITMEAPVAPDGGMAQGRHGPDRPANVSLSNTKLHAVDADFYVSNIKAAITLSNDDLSSDAGVIVRSVSGQWGPLGRNGGDAWVSADHQTLTGDFVTDVISSIRVNLTGGSHFTGKATQNVDLTLDATSTWTLSDDCGIGKLDDAAGISGDTVANITGNGHTIHYDATRNAALGGKTYQLTGGGTLEPGI